MSINITIRQKLFGSKTMPLDVILGENLSYGFWENDQLTDDKLGDTEFIAYDPKAIGRGFSVIWNPREKKSISLRLPSPSTPMELREFFDCVSRMVNYWGGPLIVDGTRLKLDAFLSSYEDMVTFNYKFLDHVCHQVSQGENENMTLYSAKWALSLGREEAETFLKNPEAFGLWLHEKQAMDVFYCNPRFYMGDQGIFGQYMLMNHLPAVLPVKPSVPFGMTGPSTGKPLTCDQWRIALVIEGEKDLLCEMDYDNFLNLLPREKKIRYDGNHFLIEEMTEAELRKLSQM